MSTYYGNWAGPGPSYFSVVIEMSSWNDADDSTEVFLRRYVQAADGSNFGGTLLNTSWAGQIRLYGGGTYADTGWVSLGRFGYGADVGWDTNANYTSYSSGYHESSVTAHYYPPAPTWEPYALTDGSLVRNSDNKVTLSWSRNEVPARKYAGIRVERKVNGGSWSLLENIAGSATTYLDQSTSAGNYYEYRARPYNSSGSSEWLALGTAYMTPNAPTNLQWERVGDTDVKLTMTNSTNTATALEVEYRQASSQEWHRLSPISGTVTETVVSVGGGEWYMRVRNTRGSLASAWVETTKVVTIIPPNAPTLNSPASSSVVNKDAGEVRLAWTHNPLDGSAQTAAEVQYKVGSGEWSAESLTSDSYLTLSIADVPVNATVTWKVRTKGAHADFSPWSAESSFTVRQVPTVSITKPIGTVTATPLEYSFTYSDPSGTLQSAALTVSDDSGVIFAKSIGKSMSGSIPRDELLLPDGGTYTIAVTTQSTSTLSATATSQFDVEYDLPTGAGMSIQYDAENGIVNIGVDPLSTGGQPTVSYDIQRTSGSGWVTLASGLTGHTDYVDRYAPSNTDYQYRVITYADSGAFRESVFDAFFDTKYFYLVSGNLMAKAMYNPAASESIACADANLIRYAGRRYPVLYEADAIDDSFEAGGVVVGKYNVEPFRAIQFDGGKAVYKSHDGIVAHVHCSLQVTRNMTTPPSYEVSVSMERIDGGAL